MYNIKVSNSDHYSVFLVHYFLLLLPVLVRDVAAKKLT
jgi:hypothetical protein